MRACNVWRLLLAGTVVFALAPVVSGQSKRPRPPASSQSSRTETVNDALRRLRGLESKKASRKDLALRTGLEFCLALGEPKGTLAAELLDVVGYQVLPLEGELPEKPEKPLDRQTVTARVDARELARVGNVSVERFQLLDHTALRAFFPAVAKWMLPQDLALLVEPTSDETDNWVTRQCCLVLRLRARKVTVIGGNLFAALETEDTTKLPTDKRP